MSVWIDIDKESIDLSDDKKEIHINYGHNKFGEKYVSVKVEDVLSILRDEGA